MTRPSAVVLSGDGINCDAESNYALQLAGFAPEVVHVTNLLGAPEKLAQAKLLVLPGGFSYGDEIASGKVLAIKLKDRLQDALFNYVDKGNVVLGICNGFQVLVQLGLLPNSQRQGERMVSLLRNSHQKFVNQWVKLKVEGSNPFFTGLHEIELPIRHGEGRVTLKPGAEDDPEAVKKITSCAPLRYAEDVNGSFDKIAALANQSGNVLGLMPHPEAFVRWTQFYAWTTRKAEIAEHEKSDAIEHLPHGLAIFRNIAGTLN